MKYTYTAVLIPREDGSGYTCRIPDLPGCVTSGADLGDAMEMITDAASLWLVSAEDDDDPIPAPTPQHEMTAAADAFLSLVCVDTLRYRAEIDNRAVRKNVTMPAWMANLAEKQGVNFSQAIQEKLTEVLSA